MARKYLYTLTKAFVFYMLLFALCRLVFLGYFFDTIITHGYRIFFESLSKAIPLDVSTASYLLFIPALTLLFTYLLRAKFLMSVFRIYLFCTAFIFAFLAMLEIGVYREVHIKMYFNLLNHAAHIDEIFHTVSRIMLVTLLSFLFALGYFSYRFIAKLFADGRQYAERLKPVAAVKLFVAFGVVITFLVLGCRGGLRPIPINEGEVYFSDNQCVNDATVNALWNIVHSFIENEKVLAGNAYKVMPDEEANAVVSKLFSVERDTTIYLFKVAKPNVCVLILESWSADLIASLGGYQGITPNFEKLVSNGYLFTHVKPAGHVSDQGVPAILSGYPALPIGSAINQPERQVNLANINNQFSEAGYYSSFFFGGQLIYGNIKTYIFRNKFNVVTEQQDLPSSIPAGRLGIHDSIMLGIWHDSINTYRQPFLTGLFTLSTHSPFDEPGSQPITWGGLYQPYLNSAVYADRQLGKFFEDAKKEKWYDSTIFIIVADHSHGTPKDYSYESPEFYHIPLLIYGGALKEEFRGVKNEYIASQTDIASTLLHQLGYSSEPYRWSKNLLNPYTQHFAFYTFDEGFGFVDTTGTVIWNKKFPSLNRNTAVTTEGKDMLNKKGSAMLQTLMNDFLSK